MMIGREVGGGSYEITKLLLRLILVTETIRVGIKTLLRLWRQVGGRYVMYDLVFCLILPGLIIVLYRLRNVLFKFWYGL